MKVKLSLDTEDFEAIFQDLDYLKSIKIETLQPRTMAILQLIISECVRKSYKAQYKANFLEDVDYDVLINCLYKD